MNEKELHPGLGSGALREPVAFVIETEGGDLYDQGRVLFSDALQAQDRADDLNDELGEESFRVAPLYRALSLSSPPDDMPNWCSCFQRVGEPAVVCEPHKLITLAYQRGLAAQASSEIRELQEALRQWKCPACNGTRQYSGYSANAPEGQPCRKCKDTEGLHPVAYAALAPSRQGAGGK